MQFGNRLNKSIHDAIDNKLDNIAVLNETLKRYEKINILKKRGIVNAGLIIRKHHEKNCIKLMDKWWEEVENHSHVDNFAFNYASLMTGVDFLHISYHFTLDYFGHNNHLKKIDY